MGEGGREGRKKEEVVQWGFCSPPPPHSYAGVVLHYHPKLVYVLLAAVIPVHVHPPGIPVIYVSTSIQRVHRQQHTKVNLRKDVTEDAVMIQTN